MGTRNTDDRQFDIRNVERRIAKGELDTKDYETYLKGIPDSESNAEFLNVFEEPPAEEPTPHVDELTFTSA